MQPIALHPQVNFSPDAKYVLSGDSEGRAFFWEWRHPGKIVRTIKAHDGVCIGVAWNPMESSKVATCGWDGLIKVSCCCLTCLQQHKLFTVESVALQSGTVLLSSCMCVAAVL